MDVPVTRRRARGPIAIAVAAVVVAATGLVVNTMRNSTEAEASVGGLVWSDDFEGTAGSAVDSSKWNYDTGGEGWGNNELEYYTSGNQNAALDGNGNLVITARQETVAGSSCWYGTCQYSSARLLTSGTFTQQYGRFEARIQLPSGQGIWPAFWALGDDFDTVGWPNNGEIDIMENVGYEPGTVHGTIHGPGYSGGSGLGGSYTLADGAAFSDGFHTFAVDWGPDSLTWYVDGVQYSQYTSADVGDNEWVFDHPFFLILNVAVGGNWPGSPDETSTYPQQMVVDYVHVYEYTETVDGPTGNIVGAASGRCVDVDGAQTSNGTAIQLYDCNGTAAQSWTVGSDGSIRALGKCMDVTDGSTENGALVQLYDCNGTGAQQWAVSSANDIVNIQANKCLDAKDTGTANGTRLQIWECGGDTNQKWTTPTA